MKETKQPEDKYIVRFPDGMRPRIAEAAKANNRSMNAEIVLRLEQSFDAGSSPIARLLAEFAEKQERMLFMIDAMHRWVQQISVPGSIELIDDEEFVAGKPKQRQQRRR